MDWSAYIDAYCERTAPGLLNEPLNAISNASFVVAAWLAARKAGREGGDGAQWALIIIVAMIGIGSLLFHTFATRWSMLADVLPITVFIYGFLGFALRRFFRLSWPLTIALVAALGLFNAGVERFLPADLFNGSIMYLPAVAALLISSAAASIRALPPARLLALAGGTLLLSLVFRTIDRETCALLPSGTHFLWHILNGVVLWFCLDAALKYGKPVPK